jgi:hypothetical protein
MIKRCFILFLSLIICSIYFNADNVNAESSFVTVDFAIKENGIFIEDGHTLATWNITKQVLGPQVSLINGKGVLSDLYVGDLYSVYLLTEGYKLDPETITFSVNDNLSTMQLNVIKLDSNTPIPPNPSDNLLSTETLEMQNNVIIFLLSIILVYMFFHNALNRK